MHFDEPELADGPSYCPRCGRVEPKPGALCTSCGESLRAQGYCPVCEQYWPRDVGADCPKHDIPLEAASALPVEGDPAEATARWVAVSTYADALAAEAPRQRLEAEGIPTFIDGSRMGSRSMYNIATGGVRLLVPEPLAGDARILLSQSWATPPEIDGVEDVWEDLSPEPPDRRRPVLKILILLWLLGPIALFLLAGLVATIVRFFPWPHWGG
jgi:hypothetical protein